MSIEPLIAFVLIGCLFGLAASLPMFWIIDKIEEKSGKEIPNDR